MLSHGAFAQQSNDMLLQQQLQQQQLQQQQLRSGIPGQPISGQLPRITNAPSLPLTPEQSRQLQQLAPSAPPAAAVQAAEPLRPEEKLEFEEFISKSLGRELPLYGHNLFLEAPSTFAPLDQIAVPADYVIGPGDEIYVRAWGQIEIDYRVIVDRDGRIHIPRVGSVTVSGLPYQDLDRLIRRAVGRVFKNFELNVTLGQLRSIQIFVVGQARRPGSYVVSSLSTLVNALFVSGGPTHKGTMRRIQLKRGNKVVTEFDLYDLLLKGDKSKDAQLLPGDVIFVPPIGALSAITGSVNVPGIFELKGGQKLDDLMQMAGGLSTSAAGQKVTLERIYERKNRVVEELALDAAGLARALADGDIVNVFTLSPRIVNSVTIRGNVATPRRFEWKQGMRVSDVIPERSMLVVPDYWMERNRAGRPQSWLIEDEEPATDTLGRRKDIQFIRERERQQEAGVQGRERRDTEKVRRDVKRPGAEVNWDYAVVERLNPADFSTILIAFNLGRAIDAKASDHDVALEPGDIVTIFSKDDILGPEAKHSKFVRLEGEFEYAGVYQIVPGETLRQLVARVGGVTADAYIYGAEFTRDATRAQQQKKLEETLDRLEAEAARAATTRSQSVVSKEDAESLAQQAEAQRVLLAKLRQIKATGRIVLEVPRARATLNDIPELALEDGDRLFIPSRPSTVSVFGAVYNQNAFLYKDGKRIGDYLGQAGGPTRDADKGSLYLIKADGTVVSKQQSGRFFNSFDGQAVVPGDAIVVPEELIKVSWTKELRDWSQIFYQFALGVAGLKVLSDL